MAEENVEKIFWLIWSGAFIDIRNVDNSFPFGMKEDSVATQCRDKGSNHFGQLLNLFIYLGG